jgi:hypothetical protein
MAENKPGYVYIFTNESFREGWVKIGKTQDIKKRLNQLDNTSCPMPFDVYATLKTKRYDEAEEFVHDFISHFNSDLRVRPNREYFKVNPEEALDILYKVMKLMNEPDSEIIVNDEKGKLHLKKLEKKYGRSCSRKSDKPDVTPQSGAEKTKSKAKGTREPKVWLIPANPKFFNHKACFEELGQIYWAQYFKFQVGDTGYIYFSHPKKCITYKFKVIASELPYSEEMKAELKFYKNPLDFEKAKQNNRYFVIEKIGESTTGILSSKNMTQHGMKGAPMGAMELSKPKYNELLKYIEEYF